MTTCEVHGLKKLQMALGESLASLVKIKIAGTGSHARSFPSGIAGFDSSSNDTFGGHLLIKP
jgi:hypothetical protein